MPSRAFPGLPGKAVDHTNDRLSALERRVYQLEGEVRRLRAGVVRNGEVPSAPVHFPNDKGPFAPPESWPVRPVPMPGTPAPDSFSQRCAACGIKLEGVMSYSCPRHPCPTGLGGVQCGGGK